LGLETIKQHQRGGNEFIKREGKIIIISIIIIRKKYYRRR
jgi:hypothetical protein